MLVDEFYAVEKSMRALADGVETTTIDHVVDTLMSGDTRTIWH